MARFLSIVAAAGLVLGLSAPVALAQDTTPAQTQKQKAPAGPLDPKNPDDLKQIVDEAEAAYLGTTQPQDYARAFELFSLGAKGGDAYALNRLGLMYDAGNHVAENDVTAFQLFERAAALGLPVAMTNLGNMYENGDGTTQDHAKAAEWYQKSADAGHALGMYYLAGLYADGRGVEANPETAAEWLQQAVDLGQPDAHWSLAIRYLYGEGVVKDMDRAGDLAYYALTHGVNTTLEELKTIESADTSPKFRRRLQQLLADNGFYKGRVDGTFGPDTIAALEAAFGTE